MSELGVSTRLHSDNGTADGDVGSIELIHNIINKGIDLDLGGPGTESGCNFNC
jgi:hypothetical protein